MFKLLLLLFFLLPLTSNAQLYISPIIGIDGLQLEPKGDRAIILVWMEDTYVTNNPSFGGNISYRWNRLSISYQGIWTKKNYNFFGKGYQGGDTLSFNNIKQNLFISYRIFKGLNVRIGVHYMLYKRMIFGFGQNRFSRIQPVSKELGIQLGLSYSFKNFVLSGSYNRGLESDVFSYFKPSKSYSIYLGYQFKIFDPKWLNKKGQKCPKF